MNKPVIASSLLLVLLSTVAACTPGGGTAGTRTPTEASSGQGAGAAAEVAAGQGGTISLPGGVQLEIPAGALSQDARVALTDLGPAEPPTAGHPIVFSSGVVSLDLGGATLEEPATLSFPLAAGGVSLISASNASHPVYAVVTQSDEGYMELLGATVEDNKAQAHAFKPGQYALVAVPNLDDLFSFLDPLQVPSYGQKTPAWCSPTAMTDLAAYHEGAWPAGGDGSVFGESSNWYLAGNAGQPFDSGMFFHLVLSWGGGFDVPVPVGISFSNAQMDVVIWYFDTPILEDREALWVFFRAYVESYLWGMTGMDPRPVAWGSSLAGHSRVITGSDGTNFYYNETGNGAANLSKTWEAYKQDVMNMAQGEVIDTVVFFFPVRPEAERRGVIWLSPGHAGSIRYLNTPDTLSWWVWDGEGTHDLGYYYDDTGGSLPDMPVIDNAFYGLSPADQVSLNFSVYNIAAQAHSYHMNIDLIPEGGPLQQVYSGDTPALASHQSWNSPETLLPLQPLGSGFFTLKYTLSQGGVINDVKYVEFAVQPLPMPEIPVLYPRFKPELDVFCRQGPGTNYPALTGIPAGEELEILGISQDGFWFFTEWDQFPLNCWVAGSTGVTEGDLTGLPVIAAPPTPTSTAAPSQTPSPTYARPTLTPTATPRR
jgi:hypothetical protein